MYSYSALDCLLKCIRKENKKDPFLMYWRIRKVIDDFYINQKIESKKLAMRYKSLKRYVYGYDNISLPIVLSVCLSFLFMLLEEPIQEMLDLFAEITGVASETWILLFLLIILLFLFSGLGRSIVGLITQGGLLFYVCSEDLLYQKKYELEVLEKKLKMEFENFPEDTRDYGKGDGDENKK